jgi:hypothetical protein
MIEHDIWLRNQLITGYEYGMETNDKLLLHKDIATLEELVDSREIKLDEAFIDAARDILIKESYKLRKIDVNILPKES